MGGKKQPKANKKAGQQNPIADPKQNGAGGPSRVYFLRHGQSESNASGQDIPDPLLTELCVSRSRSCNLFGGFTTLLAYLSFVY